MAKRIQRLRTKGWRMPARGCLHFLQRTRRLDCLGPLTILAAAWPTLTGVPYHIHDGDTFHLTCEQHQRSRSYGRLVALCRLPDGRDVAAEMIEAGQAREWCRYSRGYYGGCGG